MFNKTLSVKSLTNSFLFLFFSLIVLLLVYSFVIWIPYAHHNDFVAWSYDHKTQNFPEHNHLVQMGRTLGAYLISFQFSFFDTLQDMMVGRIVSITVAAISMGLFGNLLYRTGISSYAAFLISLMVFMLPGMQIYILWLTNFAPGPVTILVVLIASLLLERGLKIPLQSRTAAFKAYSYIAFSLFIYILTLFIYPANSMFFLVPPLAIFLFEEKIEMPLLVKKLKAYSFVFLVGNIIYYLTHRFLFFPLFGEFLPESARAITTQGGYSFLISTNLESIISKMFLIGNVSLNLWNIFPTHTLSFIVLVVVLLGLKLEISRVTRELSFIPAQLSQNHIFHFVLSIIAFGMLLLVFNIPAILGGGPIQGSYRTLFPFSAIISLVLFKTLKVFYQLFVTEEKINNYLSYSLLTLSIAVGMSVQYNLYTTAQQENMEVAFVRQKIYQWIRSEKEPFRAIDFVRKKELVSFFGLPFHHSSGEFNFPATYGTGQSVITYILKKLDYNKGFPLRKFNDAAERENYYEENQNESKSDNLLIDMNEFYESLFPELILKKEIINKFSSLKKPDNFQSLRLLYPVKVEASGSYPDPVTGYSPEKAFDGITHGLNSSWHSPPPAGNRGWISCKIHESAIIKGFVYTIRDDMTDQAPETIELLGSHNGRSWEKIALLKAGGWVQGESKAFDVDNDKEYNYYKFDFESNNQDFISIVELSLYGL